MTKEVDLDLPPQSAAGTWDEYQVRSIALDIQVYEQLILEEEIVTLITQLQDLLARKKAEREDSAVKAAKEILEEAGLPPEKLAELLQAVGAPVQKKRGRPKDRAKGKPVKRKPKYRNPDDPSQTWAGVGLRPKWLTAKISDGAELEEFLIDKTSG